MPDDKMVQTAINTIRTLSIDAVQAVDADYEKLGQSAVTLDDFRVVRDGIVGGHRVTTVRQVPFCMFTDPEFARIGLSETEARQRGIAYRLAKIPMATVLRAQTLSETRGFMKALINGS